MKFKYPCHRCGYCCLHVPCKRAIEAFRQMYDEELRLDIPCPFLRWEGG